MEWNAVCRLPEELIVQMMRMTDYTTRCNLRRSTRQFCRLEGTLVKPRIYIRPNLLALLQPMAEYVAIVEFQLSSGPGLTGLLLALKTIIDRDDWEAASVNIKIVDQLLEPGWFTIEDIRGVI